MVANECNLFKDRINNLLQILDKLNKISEIKNISSLKERLNQLLSNVNQTESLNTGGNFEWVDSKIVTALRAGEFISLEHVNFSSLAVLDRLNPIFEPNGKLLISEKGVSRSDECEVIEKHDNFQAFLTIDPKNGELSRAMRNRCIELALCTDNYTLDDLRSIIYINGIHDMNLIKTVLNIHNEINSLSEIQFFTISHLSKFSFLLSSYLKIGSSYLESMHYSVIEVYVNSCSVDLLGFGLKYYKNKVDEIIKINMEKQNFDKICLGSTPLNTSNMNTLDLVHYQIEPLKYLLEGDDLSLLLFALQDFKYKDREDIIKFYILKIYELSSLNDLSLRNKYIEHHFSKQSNVINWSNSLFKSIINFESKIKTNANLPWNTKMFPKIREYNSRNDILENQISLSLICEIIFNDIKIEKEKLNKISAISYSHAVSLNLINDKLNNVFLRNLYEFLNEIKSEIKSIIPLKEITTTTYIKTLISFLWVNRFTMCASNKIFKEKHINKDLLDKLVSHFKWLNKHLIVPFLANVIDDSKLFAAKYTQMLNFCKSIEQPLNALNKFYTKRMLEFNSFYTEKEINLFKICTNFNDMVEIIPR